jgi:hypothetical protein
MLPHYGTLDQLARDRRTELLTSAHARRLTRRAPRSRRSRVRALLPLPATALDATVCTTS